MFLARVIGSVWSTVKWPEVEGIKLLIVRPYHYDDLVREAQGEGGDMVLSDAVVVADALGAGVGEDVVVAYGHAARVGLEGITEAGVAARVPVDAAVVAIVDRLECRPMEQEDLSQ